MAFKDVTATMVTGEARTVSPGKLLLQVSSHIPLRSAPDIALAVLGADQKALPPSIAICRSRPTAPNRSVRLLFEAVSDGLWSASVFEISTLLLPDDAVAVTVLASNLIQASGGLTLTVEDGMSRPHVYPVAIPQDTVSALVFSLYRRAGEWRARAVGQCFQSEASQLAVGLGLVGWPESATPASATRSTPKPAETLAPQPAQRSVPPSGHSALPPLDLERLSAMEKDTAAVSALLSDIFSDASPPPPPAPTPPVVVSPGKLDPQHAAILSAIMAQVEMTGSSFADMVRRNGLMPSGATETINDWAFDMVGDIAIIDVGDGVRFNEDMRRAIEHNMA